MAKRKEKLNNIPETEETLTPGTVVEKIEEISSVNGAAEESLPVVEEVVTEEITTEEGEKVYYKEMTPGQMVARRFFRSRLSMCGGR